MLKERGIDVKWANQVLADPVCVEPDKSDVSLEHRLGVIAENEGRVWKS